MTVTTRFKIVCAAGVLVHGSSPDFLVCIAKARESKHEWRSHLPNSTLRLQFFYPNNTRVPAEDIKAALRSLADPSVAAAVAVRRAAAGAFSPARSEARTAGNAPDGGCGFASVVDPVFCQAGVVAPPDSLTGETLVNSDSVELAV